MTFLKRILTPYRTEEQELQMFRSFLPQLLKTHPGQYALFRQDELAGVYSAPEEALRVGRRKWGRFPYVNRRFWVQRIT